MATDLARHQTSNVLDLTGLREPVVEQVTQMVREAREKQAPGPDDGQTAGGKPSLRRLFAHRAYSFTNAML